MARETKRALRPPPRVPVRLLKTGDEKVDRVVRSLVSATEKSRADQHAKGKTVTVTAPGGAGGEVVINHGLGYKPTSFERKSASGVSHVQYRVVSSDSRRATLNFNSGTATVVLWVY